MKRIATRPFGSFEEYKPAIVQMLEQQNIRLSSLGSIAEASLQVTGIFEAAQKAADLYLDAAKLQARIIEDEAKKTARTILANAEITGKFAAVLQPKSLDDRSGE